MPGGLAVSGVWWELFWQLNGHRRSNSRYNGLIGSSNDAPTNYSPELATGVLAASRTLGQIIPPIVIVLLGTLTGDIYSAAQEDRAQLAGCTDALTYLVEPAVVSVGTLFKAALLPGLCPYYMPCMVWLSLVTSAPATSRWKRWKLF